MDHATNIAIIYNGVVQNIIWGSIYDVDEFNDGSNLAVPIDDLCVGIGDIYRYDTKRFYRDGEEVIYTVEEEHQNEIDEYCAYIIEMEYENIIDFDNLDI